MEATRVVAAIAAVHCSGVLVYERGSSDKEYSMNIFVGNIAFTASEDDLRELFEQHGTVDKVHLITDRYTGRSRGFGFVEMPNADEAKAAIETLNGAALHNRPLTVNEARPREPRRDGGRREY
jgi:RNA recognition motif-containing protein